MSGIMEALKQTLGEIDDILAKSSYMAKDDMQDEEATKGAPDAGVQSPAEEMGAAPGAGAPEGEQAPEGALDEGAPAPEGEQLEGEGMEDEQSIEEHAASMSDEELDMMMQVLSAEQQKRQAAQAPEAAPAAPGAGAPGAEAGQLAQSMKDDYAKMHKSMADMAVKLEKTSEELAALKAKPAKLTSKAASTSQKDVQVLEKSTPAAKRLNKSETQDYLLGQMRKKNRDINSNMIAEANLIKTEEQLIKFQDALAVKGIEIPKK